MTQAPGDSEGQLVRRLWWAGSCALALAIVVIARTLSPNPAGHGTHEQLGLPACAFFAWTGMPCPACGLTTSFAYMAEGALAPAFMSHPLGIPLFLLVVLAIPTCAWACLRAWPIVDTLTRFAPRRRARTYGVALAVASVAAWLFNLFVHVRAL